MQSASVDALKALGKENKNVKGTGNELMRTFNIQNKQLKGELQPLLEAVQKLNHEDISEDTREALRDFLDYSQLLIPDHDNSSTGRIALVRSTCAIEHFGRENAQLMFNILNRMSLSMISK